MTRNQKTGIITIGVGALDWFARFQTVNDLLGTITATKVAVLASQWWLSPVLIIVGLVIFYGERIFSFGESQLPTEVSPTQASIADSGNSTASATGGNVTQHFYGVPPPASSAIQAMAQSELLPCIERLDIRSATITRTNEFSSKWIENPLGYLAHIVEFRNRQADIGKEGAEAKDVVARLIFTPKNAKRVVNNAACWLDAATQRTTIKPGEVQKLVVAVDLKDDSVSTLYNPREFLPAFYSQRLARKYRPAPIEPLRLADMPCDVELTLVCRGRTLYNESYQLQRASGALQLTPKRR